MNLQTQKQITIGKETVIATYPTVAQKLEIEARKLIFSNNLYGDIARSAHNTGNKLLDTIDAFTYFSVCCPDLKLKIDDFKNMTEITSVLFVKAFKEQFWPWYSNIEEELSKFDIDDKKSDEETK